MKMLTRMWNRFMLEGPSSEEQVVATLRTLDERIIDLRFLAGLGADPEDLVVALRGTTGRVPIGALGDGVRYYLTLALALAGPVGGILLIDEIETGLHYGLMADLWKLVITGARQSDIQVFATTHSADCIRGLRWLAANEPEMFEDVAVVKIVPSLPNAIVSSGESLRIALEHDLELR
jgi:predicted ATPase